MRMILSHADRKSANMGPQEILSYLVTVLGIALCAFSAAFMLRGKAIPGSDNTPQVIKYKDFEVRTNSIIMLMIVSVAVSVMPLGLQAYVDLHRKPPPLVATASAMPEKTTIFVDGHVANESGEDMEQALVTATNTETQSQLKEVHTDQSGAFDLPLKDVNRARDRIKLVVQKEGYKPQTFILRAESVTIPAVLVKREEQP
jgi:hypothetical protein